MSIDTKERAVLPYSVSFSALMIVLIFFVYNFNIPNDTKGHAFGDKILAAVGKALTDSFRTANCYRYGGDEFLIIAENETEEAFRQSCEDAKRRLEAAGTGFSEGYE